MMSMYRLLVDSLIVMLLLPTGYAQRRVQALVGGYHIADKHDESVKNAAKFALVRLQAGGTNYKGFTAQNVEKVSIARAETQVVAGMNFRLTLVVKNVQGCLGAFDVDIYDHFGEMSITKWGDEYTCKEGHEISTKFKRESNNQVMGSPASVDPSDDEKDSEESPETVNQDSTSESEDEEDNA